MKKIKIGNQEHSIDCENEMCGNCSYKPQIGDQICYRFNVMLDNVNSGFSNNSGWKRCTECINAEVIHDTI